MRNTREPLAREGHLEYDRVLFFNDAVFAIAITLLVVDLRPPASSVYAGTALRQAVPSIIGFAISFAVIGLFWLGHHGIFRYVNAFDRPLVLLNLLFLGTIAFLPYPTELLSQGSGSQTPAVIFYAACAAAAGLAEAAVWLYATRAGLAERASPPLRRYYLLRILRVPAVFLLSIPVALISPTLAAYLWILIWVTDLTLRRRAPLPDPEDHLHEGHEP